MYYPSLKQARAIAACGAYRKIPVSRELLSDFTTPIQALRILRARSGHCFLLESAADSGGWGRYSFLGFDPTLEVTCTDGLLTLRGEEPLRRRTAHPGQALRELLAAHKSPRLPGLPPFTGGLVGYFSYDYVKYAEPALVLDAQDQEGFQDMDLMLFEKVVVFDHFRQKLILIVSAGAEDLDVSYPAACAELERMAQKADARIGEVDARRRFKQLHDRAVAVDLEHLAAARAAVGEDDLCQLVIRDALHMVHDHQRAGNFADRLIFTDHSSFSPFSAIAAICSSISTSRFA